VVDVGRIFNAKIAAIQDGANDGVPSSAKRSLASPNCSGLVSPARLIRINAIGVAAQKARIGHAIIGGESMSTKSYCERASSIKLSR